MSSKKRNIFLYLGKVILVTLLIVLFIRLFLVESYSVSSSQMETSLLKGDNLFIDKTAYGIRLPITPLTIPFTFDHFLGNKSYSTTITFPYKRIFEQKVEVNDIVLFNNPNDTGKPLDKRNLILSRCVALPGDTILLSNGVLLINGKKPAYCPDVIEEYAFRFSDAKSFKNIAEQLSLPIRNLRQNTDTIFIQLSRYENYILEQNIPDSLKVSLNNSDTIPMPEYKFAVPYQGQQIGQNGNDFTFYAQVIMLEQGNNAKVRDGKLFIQNKQQNSYIIKENYYWMLSDNSMNSLDSRTLGFIPFSNIIGKGRIVWYSVDDNGNIRPYRCLSNIN